MQAKRALRIAIADDEPDMRRFLESVVSRLGHRVVTSAKTGVELVERCRIERPDLVITDIKMPDLDGLEAARRIYKDGPLPIIVVSAFHDEPFVLRAEENHIAAYLVKPIKASNLAPAISIVMRRFDEFLELGKEASDLRQALADRKIIERAKGILMKEAHLDEESAFRRLQKLASARSEKLAAVAQSIIDAAEILRPDAE
jgi:AmiR/NasT family two-component response regulator